VPRRPSLAPTEFPRSSCPIAVSLDLLGDRWTLVVVRDLVLLGKRRFAELLESSEGIATNVLAERLERLEHAGLVERRRYQEHPPRDEYHPTAIGRDLRPILLALVRWGNRHFPGTFVPPPELLRGKPSARPPRPPGKTRKKGASS